MFVCLQDLLCVIAYGPQQSRPYAVSYLFHYWPQLNPSLTDRRGVHFQHKGTLHVTAAPSAFWVSCRQSEADVMTWQCMSALFVNTEQTAHKKIMFQVLISRVSLQLQDVIRLRYCSLFSAFVVLFYIYCFCESCLWILSACNT